MWCVGCPTQFRFATRNQFTVNFCCNESVLSVWKFVYPSVRLSLLAHTHFRVFCSAGMSMSASVLSLSLSLFASSFCHSSRMFLPVLFVTVSLLHALHQCLLSNSDCSYLLLFYLTFPVFTLIKTSVFQWLFPTVFYFNFF